MWTGLSACEVDVKPILANGDKLVNNSEAWTAYLVHLDLWHLGWVTVAIWNNPG